MILAVALISLPPGVDGAQSYLLPDGLHRRRIQLNTVEGFCGGRSPVKVKFSVLIHKQVRIPEGKRSLNPLVLIAKGIPCAVENALLMTGGTEIQIFSGRPHIRRVIIDGQMLRRLKFPVGEILTVEKARCHGRKKQVFPLKADQRGVRRLPGGHHAAVILLVELILVTEIQWIAIDLHSCSPLRISFR